MAIEELSQLARFDFLPRTRLIFGANVITDIGNLARELGAQRVLVVSDHGLVAVGHTERVESLLRNAGLHVATYHDVHENPTTADVARCLAVARSEKIDLLVGLGGGSSLDTAKGCNFLLTNGGEMKDYWGVGKATKPMLPMIAVPTTAGTGSECQSAALIADESTHQKMACLDPKAAARIALLDPTLTLTLPRPVTAVTGVDALAHALESAVTTRRNPISTPFAREALRLGFAGLPICLAQPSDINARSKMLLAAAYAGIAIEYSMLGAAHAAANPLTAHFNVIHGAAVGLMLPHILRFNGEFNIEIREIYADLALSAGILSSADRGRDRAWTSLIFHLESLLNQAGIPRSLPECGVAEKDIPMLAAEAAQQWTGKFNPRTISQLEFTQIYQAAMQNRF